MATVKLDREDARSYDKAHDVDYEDQGHPEVDEGAHVEYPEEFADEDAGESSQEWRSRSQK
ncbi:MAG: hypothetical protein M3Y54_01225 [Bacteroidota bacterium]|nr:hypothetical protein [Bacteroidota bacterium]